LGSEFREEKNSTQRKRLGCDDLAEFDAFSTDVPWFPLEALPLDLDFLMKEWSAAA
jgi:hypothetical protein